MKIMKPRTVSSRVIGIATLLKHCREGETLQKGFACQRGGSVEIAYYLLGSGKRVRAKDAIAAIASGKLAPQADGLFADTPQSWIYNPPPRRSRALTDAQALKLTRNPCHDD